MYERRRSIDALVQLGHARRDDLHLRRLMARIDRSN
jgi:hypothetical protein